MAYLTDSYPPGPCGHCGRPEGVEVSVTWDWHNDTEEYGLVDVNVRCECGVRPKIFVTEGREVTNLVELWGGRTGYAVGIASGPKFQEAKEAGGWKRYHPLKLDR